MATETKNTPQAAPAASEAAAPAASVSSGAIAPAASASAGAAASAFAEIETALTILDGKYKAIILYHLLAHGVLRFHQLQALLPQARSKVLSQRLKELVRDGLVHREVYAVVPPKTEYSLTDLGRTLAPLLEGLRTWGRTYIAQHAVRGASEAPGTPDEP